MSNPIIFEFILQSRSEKFYASTSDTVVIAKARAELRLPLKKRSLHINGQILASDGGHNAPWSWHFRPSDWELVEQSIELCDAWPSYVEANLRSGSTRLAISVPGAQGYVPRSRLKKMGSE